MKIRSHIAAVLSFSSAMFAAVGSAHAQSNFVLHTFSPAALPSILASGVTNKEGANPNGWLTLVGTNFYGTAFNGGTNATGTIFSFNTNGAFNLLFTFPTNLPGTGNFYGANPNGGMAYSNGVLYGTTYNGGIADQGGIFAISTNGTGIQVLHSFTDASSGFNGDGANPGSGLIIAGTNLFGTAADGGTGSNGVVFACNSLASNSLKILHYFSLGGLWTNITAGPFGPVTNVVLTNSDGANPKGSLILSGITLYGTTSGGGTNGNGTVFAVNTNGNAFTILHYFDANSAAPDSGLVLSGGTLFGMSGNVLYSLNTNGTGYTVLEQFGSLVDSGTTYDFDSGLTVSNGTLYGALFYGGTYNYGQIFALNTNGTSFADFHDFTIPLLYPTPATNYDGIFPNGGLVQLNTSLYGATYLGGTNGSGVLFMAVPAPTPVSSHLSNKTNFTVSFPTLSGMSYTVQQSTNLTVGNWTTFSNFVGSTMSNQFTVSATNKTFFFRVRQP